MRPGSKIIIFIFTILTVVVGVHAQSPREQLVQMVEQLQKDPTDNALRERIIKLAPTLKRPPALPADLERRMARGTAAFKGAKSLADYQDAAKEFEQATLAAPWFGDAYFNLGVAQDRAENYEVALRSLKFALLASPESKEIKALIFEVEYRQEKANSPAGRAAQQKARESELLKSLEGAVFSGSYTTVERQYRISNGRAEVFDRRLQPGGVLCNRGDQKDGPGGERLACPHKAISLIGRRGERSHHFGVDSITIAEDGQTLLERNAFEDRFYEIAFRRQ